MKPIVVLVLLAALAGAVEAQQVPSPPPPAQSCESQLQSTTQYALIVKGARDQAEFSIADLRKQVAELTAKVQEMEKRISLAPPVPPK
jgi:TolA-binding protein